MGKKKAEAEAPASPPPAPAPAEADEIVKSVKKAEAVRQCILAEGWDIQPADGVEWIKAKYGIEINPQHFSSTKSQLRKKEGEPSGKRGRPATGATTRTAGGSISEAVRAVKELVDKYGADEVRALLDLLEG